MTKRTTKKNKRARNLTIAICALTLGIPMAAAALPATYVLVVPLAIVLPFFTLTYLESAIVKTAEV
jgi:fatty acid desaturase